MNEYLFVYGSLRKGFNSEISSDASSLLKENSTFVGEAFYNGKLYKADWYPVAISSLEKSAKVLGDILLIHNPEELFNELDKYEEVPELFRREKVTVQLRTGQQKEAWIYLYNKPIDTLNEIQGGNFLEYLSKQKSSV